MTDDEAALLQLFRREEWDRIIEYARINVQSPQAVFMVKGKIQESLIEHLGEFQTIQSRALATATKLGIPLRSVRYVTGLAERSRELMDAAILAVHKDRLYVLTVFESKSEGNIGDLVSSVAEAGQFAKVLERLRQGLIDIGLRKFPAHSVEVGGELTEWVAVVPRDKGLSEAAVSSIENDVGNLTVIHIPVRDAVLRGIAGDQLKWLRFGSTP